MASPVTTNGADLFKNRKILTKAGLAETVDQEPESRVLVLYTGGTIGMKTNPNGVYEPKAKFLINELKKLPMFHDEDYAKRSFSDDEVATLVMPLGLKLPYVPTVDNLDDEHRSRSLSIERVTKCGRRVKYVIKEYDPLLDSSNMNMQDWSKIAIDISMLYDEYDGFVVLHGTDTMAYTASALSFMFENLGKPIILTGSQIPIFEVRSDGRDNFLSSLIMAGHYCIPEVMVCFDNKLFRGNRTIKNDAGSFAAFISPNMAPIACLEKDITVDWSVVYRSGATEKFRVTTEMCVNVGLLRMFPGITSQTVRAFLMPPMQGVVLQSFGTGNAPDNRPDLLKVFEEAANIGIIIINITQCTKGYVDAAYATGKALYDTGVIPGGDMTPEAALTKLSYILAKPWTIDKKKKVMKKNLRGEVRIIKKEEEAKMDSELIENIADTLSLSTKEEIQKLKNALYPNLMCSAAMHNDIEALEKLRSTGGDLSSANQDGRTALHVASREGHLRLVDYLLHWGASVHMKDHHDNTPLMDAIIGKQMSIITLLVKTGAHLTLHPVRIAMELCRLGTAKLITAFSAVAAARDEVPTLKAWRAAGADLNVEDYDKRTPLHVAVSTRSMNAVKYMLQNGAKWDQEDIFGNTAKNQAEKAKDKEILKLIKETKCEQQNEEED